MCLVHCMERAYIIIITCIMFAVRALWYVAGNASKKVLLVNLFDFCNMFHMYGKLFIATSRCTASHIYQDSRGLDVPYWSGWECSALNLKLCKSTNYIYNYQSSAVRAALARSRSTPLIQFWFNAIIHDLC